MKEHEGFWSDAENIIGCPREIFFLALTLFILFSLCTSIAVEFVTDLIGFSFPMYATFKVIIFASVSTILFLFSFKAIGTKEANDDTAWLKYWVLFGLLYFVENSFESLFQTRQSSYYLLKTQFLLFCMWQPNKPGEDEARKYNYAEIIYDETIKLLYENYERYVDTAFFRKVKKA
jgi:hypothetical protein